MFDNTESVIPITDKLRYHQDTLYCSFKRTEASTMETLINENNCRGFPIIFRLSFGRKQQVMQRKMVYLFKLKRISSSKFSAPTYISHVSLVFIIGS